MKHGVGVSKLTRAIPINLVGVFFLNISLPTFKIIDLFLSILKDVTLYYYVNICLKVLFKNTSCFKNLLEKCFYNFFN